MIHIYNPSHDMVLAESRRASFTPHKLIQKFEKDLSLLPIWYCKPEDKVIASYKYDAVYERDIQRVLCVSLCDMFVDSNRKFDFRDFMPWGLNEAIVRSFTSFSDADMERVEKVRELSHRRVSIDFLSEMKRNGLFEFGMLPQEFSDIQALFNGNREEVVVKVPYSSSGRGVLFVRRDLSANHSFRKRVESAVSQVGSIIMEQRFNKVLDFAAEFELIDGKFSFAGYSLFNTSNGAYTGNILANNEVLRSRLTEYISNDELDKAIKICEKKLTELVHFTLGVHAVGVDMMIVEVDGKMALHPCVEVNLRMTMGFVARIFFDRYVCSEHIGKMEVIRHKSVDEMRKFDVYMRKNLPLVLKDGRIEKGYLRLTSGEEFNVYVIIE